MTTTLLTANGYGCRVGLRLPKAEVDAARTWLPFWWRDTNVEPEMVWDADSAAACEWVVRELELWVAEHAEDVVFIHAGAVAIEGRALLLPGRSYVGKSTLVAALLRAGADYLSDEYAVLGPDGRVHPYPRPIALRNADGSRSRVAARSLGAVTVDAAVPVGAVASLRYQRNCTLALEPSRAADAVLAMLDNAVAAQRAPERVLAASVEAVTNARTVVGVRDDASAAAEELLRFVAQPAD